MASLRWVSGWIDWVNSDFSCRRHNVVFLKCCIKSSWTSLTLLHSLKSLWVIAQFLVWPASLALISFWFWSPLFSIWTEMMALGLERAADSTLHACRAVKQDSPEVSKKKIFWVLRGFRTRAAEWGLVGHKSSVPGTRMLMPINEEYDCMIIVLA